MSERTDNEFIADIKEAVQRITVYTAGMAYETFVADIKTQDAVIVWQIVVEELPAVAVQLQKLEDG